MKTTQAINKFFAERRLEDEKRKAAYKEALKAMETARNIFEKAQKEIDALEVYDENDENEITQVSSMIVLVDINERYFQDELGKM